MHSSVNQPNPTHDHALRVEPMRSRVRLAVPGRGILAQSARAIARSRELEARVRQLETRFRTGSRNTEIADAALATLAARRSANVLASSDLVAAVSYDLRTPLQAILGYAELLAEGATGALTETQREVARRIVISGLSLAQVVENLIQLSAAQVGRMQLDFASFDLSRLITDVVRLAAPRARLKGIVLRTDLGPLEMTSDRRRLRQIVTNLVEYTIKRTERGEVVVSLGTAGAPSETTVTIIVRGSGPGIDAADLPHLFASFWEGREPVLASMPDAGLGLSAVCHLTRILGGEVRVEGEAGGASTFTVELPRLASTNPSLAG